MGALHESRVCVRYRHCERDAVDVGDGAAGVSRHPGLLHLLVRLRHGGERGWPRVGRCGLDIRSEETRMRCWPFGVARAHFNVTSSAHRPSTFLIHTLYCHTPQDQHASKELSGCQSTWSCLFIHALEDARPFPIPAIAIMAVESNSANSCSVFHLCNDRMRAMSPGSSERLCFVVMP
jgi:hypothetical protein